MRFILFHGRHNKDDKLNDWGFDGPTLRNIDYIRSTYSNMTVIFYDREACDKAKKQTGWKEGSFENSLEVSNAGELIQTKEGFFGDYTIEI